jgi:hypothetical protein
VVRPQVRATHVPQWEAAPRAAAAAQVAGRQPVRVARAAALMRPEPAAQMWAQVAEPMQQARAVPARVQATGPMQQRPVAQ